ncbi:hypothetical protein CWC12_10210 [Pseudoalteromonas ruthenica]|nr:hypothetical protein CWC12_10210 [Pseudoalteromonas ruthenica]TMP22278.1 hypothetical protein CWC06_15800 [Pseudoalteromonas ruthenica]
MFVVVGTSDEYGRVVLDKFAGRTLHEVEFQVSEAMLKERFKGTLEEFLKEVRWEICEFNFEEVVKG